MIKKISQLNELPISSYLKDYWTVGVDKEEAERKLEEMMFEVSYETATPSDTDVADEANYYTSYSINLSGMKDALTINELWESLSSLSSGSLSVISGNLVIGEKGRIGTLDRLSGNGHEYHPDLAHTITAYSKLNLENDATIHGTATFHNTVTISCNDGLQGQYPNIDNPILEVGGVATFKNVINGVSYRAQWGDLAEIYSADTAYEPGTLIAFGGEKEVTIAKNKANGIVTSEPGLILNSREDIEFPVGVAIVGKVPVKIRGPVRKFDKIVLSHTDPGIGVVYNYAPLAEIIAKALEENLDPKEKLVMCVTNFNIF